ncbi:B12-binding domain-containing radical SAM protein [candidate division WOR-3 bacterium]|nr:B12-binding domain-containing radical SAM protein [candidate division WOR-3 bacterium]
MYRNKIDSLKRKSRITNNCFNLLLILPAGAIHRAKTGIFKKSLRYAPLTLTYLASLIPKDLNINLKILDEGTDNLSSLNFDPDLVGISAMTATSTRAYAIADNYRQKGIPVVLGGVHPTLMPEEALSHADSVVVGFAERVFPELLRDFSQNKMKRIYEDPGNFPTENIPIPKRDLLKKNSYITLNSMMATRGCPCNCSFCAVPNVWRKNYFKRPVSKILEEIKTLDGNEVVFIDVHLLGDKEYSKELLEGLKPLKKSWFGLSTANALFDKEILDAVAESGCKGLLIGFETISPDSLKEIHKNPKIVTKYSDLLRNLHDNGIRVNGTFLFGTDHEDKGVFERTVEFIDKIKIDLPRYSVFTPYPGTPIFKKLEEEKRIIEYDWSMYDVEHVVYKPKNMKPEELEEGLHWAWRETYKLKSVLGRLNGTRSLYWLGLLLNLGYKYYAWKLPKCTKEIISEINLESK